VYWCGVVGGDLNGRGHQVSPGTLAVAFFTLNDEAARVAYNFFHSPVLISVSVIYLWSEIF
jgi:hypothetical protein